MQHACLGSTARAPVSDAVARAIREVEKNCFGGWGNICHRNDKKTEGNTSGAEAMRLSFSGG